MCLLVVCSRVVPGVPLIIAANRDERLDRPATSMTVLQETSPAILGGRDEQAGGTWLAVNQRGVVAGVTNRASPADRDPERRSRGELPLLLAAEETASAAFAARVEPSCYNPAWLLVGDPLSLFYIALDGVNAPLFRSLPAGIHILENLPLGTPSCKVDRARELLADPSPLSNAPLVERLTAVLSDHEIGPDRKADRPPASDSVPRRRPACVHGEPYGTRSSTIVLVADGAKPIVSDKPWRSCSGADRW